MAVMAVEGLILGTCTGRPTEVLEATLPTIPTVNDGKEVVIAVVGGEGVTLVAPCPSFRTLH